MDNEAQGLAAAHAAALEQVERLSEQIKRLSDTGGMLQARNRQLEDTIVVLRASRDKAEENYRTRSGILANVSHETRTALNAIVGVSHLLLQTALTTTQAEYVRKIEKAAHALIRTVNDVIDFSTIESGKLSLDVVDFDFSSVVGNVIDMLALRAEEKNLEFFSVIDERLPFQMRGDPLRIEQVILNLVANAVKYTRFGEIEIKVRLLEKGNDVLRVRVEVRDSGIGISPVHMARLFQPLAAAEGTSPQQYGGNGLGLAISKRLVELMGGRIWAQSTYRIGSTFFVELPLGVRSDDAPRPTDPALQGRRILVVEHDPRWRVIVQDSMKALGIDVSTCIDGTDALARLLPDPNAYDLVLATWRLPDQPVENLVKALDRKPRSGPVVAVMARGLDREEALNRLAPYGIRTILQRPFTPARLQGALLEAFGYGSDAPAMSPEALAGLRRRLQSITGKSILVVDDHPLNREIVLAFLSGSQIRVDIAGNGKEAVDLLLARPSYDLVLMDLQMPVMDGLEAARTIRKRAEFQSLPIVALTSESTPKDFENTRAAGMNAHLTKPINASELYQTLLQFLGSGRHDAEVLTAPSVDRGSPIIPGVDCGALLDRIGSSIDVMYQLLNEFVRENREIHERLRALLENSSPEAERLLHKLKGTAGNLGIDEVYRICTDLQASIRSGRSDASDTLMAELAQALEGLTRSITAATAHRHDDGAAAGPLDAEVVRARLAELSGALLRRRPLPCQRLLQELASSELAERDRVLVRQLSELVEDGSFSEALQVLEGATDLR